MRGSPSPDRKQRSSVPDAGGPSGSHLEEPEQGSGVKQALHASLSIRPPASSGAARRRMQAQRTKDTGPELALRRELHRRGYRYRLHSRPLPDLRRQADLAFVGAKVAVFVHGCFWHGCREHGTQPKANGPFWRAKLSRNRERDAETLALLEAAGWVSVVVWEHEDPIEAAGRVSAVVDARRKARPHTDEGADPAPRARGVTITL